MGRAVSVHGDHSAALGIAKGDGWTMRRSSCESAQVVSKVQVPQLSKRIFLAADEDNDT